MRLLLLSLSLSVLVVVVHAFSVDDSNARKETGGRNKINVDKRNDNNPVTNNEETGSASLEVGDAPGTDNVKLTRLSRNRPAKRRPNKGKNPKKYKNRNRRGKPKKGKNPKKYKNRNRRGKPEHKPKKGKQPKKGKKPKKGKQPKKGKKPKTGKKPKKGKAKKGKPKKEIKKPHEDKKTTDKRRCVQTECKKLGCIVKCTGCQEGHTTCKLSCTVKCKVTANLAKCTDKIAACKKKYS